jgi:tetratricopeptide (TPR) repeat protein
MDLKNKIFEIQKLISLNKKSEAKDKCEKLIRKFPNNSFALNMYGLILQSIDRINESKSYFQKAILAQSDNYAAMNNLANSYRNSYEFKISEDLYKNVIKNDPKNIKALNNYANLKRELNNYKDSKRLLLKALMIDKSNVSVLSNLVVCCQGLGETIEAKKFALKILEIQPLNTSAHKLLSSIVNYSKESDHLKKMKELISNEILNNFSSSEKVQLFFALGKAYEDIKDYKNSYYFLAKANLIEKQKSSFDLTNIKKLFHNLVELFDTIKLENSPEIETKKKCIFICGMPRSGTTLVEQIVASHNKVRGAGEIHYLSKIISDNFIENNKFNKPKILNEMTKTKNLILEKYHNILDAHQFGNNLITDKAPQNFLWIGFIKIFLPNSKIIHCHRNPKDNCLSIFKNHFSSNTMFWAYDQKDIVEYYILYSKLLEYWKTKFKNFIFDASYENIVSSPEKEVKKMISFCDLEWDPECLNFYKNKKTPVQTVSISQANKPIYKSSINSSEEYSKYLSDMFEMLDRKI